MFGHSLRSRKIDPEAPLLINHGEIPDIELETPSWRDFSAISTGMEPEEEHETHLREALVAEAAIPTPDIKIVAGWDAEIDPFPFWQPPTWYIRSAVAADSEADISSIEYDMDDEDESFLLESAELCGMNASAAEFEYVIDVLEKHQCEKSRVAIPESEVFEDVAVQHLFITKRLRSLASVIYSYWKQKRRRMNLLRRFAPFNTTGPFAAFVSRPGPRNQRRRRIGRDNDVEDNVESFALLHQLRTQSAIARDIFHQIVFREYQKRERVGIIVEALQLAVFPGKPTASPLIIQDAPEAPIAPKFKVVFKVAPSSAPISTAVTTALPENGANLPHSAPENDVKPAKRSKQSDLDTADRKKKVPNPRSRRVPPSRPTPRVLFLPLSSSESDDDSRAQEETDSDDFSLGDMWPRPLEEYPSEDDSLDQPEYALNPVQHLRPAITDDDFALSRFADCFGREPSFVSPFLPPADTELYPCDVAHPKWGVDQPADLQREAISSFRGRRRVGRGGRVIWDRFSVSPSSGNYVQAHPRFRLDFEMAPKRAKLLDIDDSTPHVLQDLVSGSETQLSCLHGDSSSSSESVLISEHTPPAPIPDFIADTTHSEVSKTPLQYDSSDDVILIPDTGFARYGDVSVPTEHSSASFLSPSNSVRVSSYPYYGSSGT